jgi:MFS family permease
MGLLGTMSAIGTTLGPSLGGVLIAGLGWRMIFLVNVPLGILNVLLAQRFLPVDRRRGTTEQRAGFDTGGTLLLAVTLAAYALAMTIGRGHFGPLNQLGRLADYLPGGVSAVFYHLIEERAMWPKSGSCVVGPPLRPTLAVCRRVGPQQRSGSLLAEFDRRRSDNAVQPPMR